MSATRQEKMRVYAARYRERNRVELREREARRREQNREALREYNREWARRKRAEDPGHFRRYYSAYHRQRRAKPDKIFLLFVGKAEKRAAEHGWDFDLRAHRDKLTARIALWRCELSGIPLASAEGKKRFDSISIDRIDAAKGYTYANVRIIAWGLNAAFSDWGEDETYRLMRRWMDRRELI